MIQSAFTRCESVSVKNRQFASNSVCIRMAKIVIVRPLIRSVLLLLLIFCGLNSQAAASNYAEIVFRLPVIANHPSLRNKGASNPEVISAQKQGLLSIEDFRGKFLYIDFWDSYCLPCRDSFPKLNKLRNEFGRYGFEVLGISVDSDPKDALRFVREHKVGFPIVSDPSALTAKVNGVKALPTGFLISPEGAILRTLNPFQTNEVYDIVRSVLVSQATGEL